RTAWPAVDPARGRRATGTTGRDRRAVDARSVGPHQSEKNRWAAGRAAPAGRSVVARSGSATTAENPTIGRMAFPPGSAATAARWFIANLHDPIGNATDTVTKGNGDLVLPVEL